MARLTKALRKQILAEYRLECGGFDPHRFAEYIKGKGPSHPAYSWFEWDDSLCGREHRAWQAREFVIGLKVVFEVEVIRFGKVSVREETAPLLFSPMDQRRAGGGYEYTDPDDPASMRLVCEEGARALNTWLRRYGGALVWAGGSQKPLEKLVGLLENGREKADAA